MVITDEQKKQFATDGFCVIPDFASPEEVKELIEQAGRIVQGVDFSQLSSVFSTKNQNKTTDDYFMKSSSNISFFLEEGAVDEDGKLLKEPGRALNKIGHAMHDLDPVFRKFSRSAKTKELLLALGMTQPTPVQSMYIFKQPSIGGEVVPHQDSAFLYTDPPSCIGIWVALEDANKENGCLWALPGSRAPDRKPVARWVQKPGGGGMAWVDALPKGKWDLAGFVPVEVKAGACVVLEGSNVHCSYENRSPVSRHAYSVHYVEGSAKWAEDNWLQRGAADAPAFEPL